MDNMNHEISVLHLVLAVENLGNRDVTVTGTQDIYLVFCFPKLLVIIFYMLSPPGPQGPFFKKTSIQFYKKLLQHHFKMRQNI